MSKNQCFIGVDPGTKGAICALVPLLNRAIFLDTSSNPKLILDWFTQLSKETNIRAIMIEEVSSVMGASASANFTFGYNVGVINALSVATGNMVDKVRPKAWQKAVGVSVPVDIKGPARKTRIKHNVAEICVRLYPEVNIYGPKGGLKDGLSDALMLAHYCYLKHKME